MKKQLNSLRAKGVDKVMCTRPPKPKISAEEPPGGVPPNVPSWCKDESTGWYGLTRFNQCFWQTEGIDWIIVDTGEVVGGIEFTHYVDMVTLWNKGELTYGEHIYPHSEWGDWNTAMQISFGGHCNPNCTATSVTGPKPLQLRTWMQFNATFAVSLPARTVENISFDSQITWAAPDSGDFDNIEYVTDGPIDLRCDNGMLKGFTNTGCVFSDTWPTLTYKRSVVEDIVGHISRAQARGNPGAVGDVPLTRMYDDADAEQNRADACSFLTGPPPTGANCDEYPMAHTYEGAYTGGGDYPGDFSVEWVDATQNSSAGGQFGSFANNQRLLDKDPFYVFPDMNS
ncbi:NucA/NucB deoxyribonuclease domain-containing protein [Nonomuraea guangzhouensis]|uniref:Deoxyribonuclease NucA/NucB domain-containing protein n=1 Tax=Nonomuraea guangzhouensis TaxID=1291555 RepID=A0ABW4GIF5_9ACTN|nr:hypothetical protein [Nonomuraea guangzhouensis]